METIGFEGSVAKKSEGRGKTMSGIVGNADRLRHPTGLELFLVPLIGPPHHHQNLSGKTILPFTTDT